MYIWLDACTSAENSYIASYNADPGPKRNSQGYIQKNHRFYKKYILGSVEVQNHLPKQMTIHNANRKLCDKFSKLLKQGKQIILSSDSTGTQAFFN